MSLRSRGFETPYFRRASRMIRLSLSSWKAPIESPKSMEWLLRLARYHSAVEIEFSWTISANQELSTSKRDWKWNEAFCFSEELISENCCVDAGSSSWRQSMTMEVCSRFRKVDIGAPDWRRGGEEPVTNWGKILATLSNWKRERASAIQFSCVEIHSPMISMSSRQAARRMSWSTSIVSPRTEQELRAATTMELSDLTITVWFLQWWPHLANAKRTA